MGASGRHTKIQNNEDIHETTRKHKDIHDGGIGQKQRKHKNTEINDGSIEKTKKENTKQTQNSMMWGIGKPSNKNKKTKE